MCADQTTRFVHAHGRNRDLRLLNISDRVCEAVEFEVHQGEVVALAIM